VRKRGPLLAQGIAYSLLLGSMPLLLLTTAVGGYLYRFVPQVQNGLHWRLRDYVPEEVATPIIVHIEAMSVGWASMGVVGIVVLLLVSKGIFDSISGGLAVVMGGTRRRSMLRNQLYSLLLTLLTIAFFIVVSLDDVIINLVVRSALLPRSPVLYRAMTAGFTTLLLGTVLLLVYAVYGRVKLNLPWAISTALGTSIIWHALGQVGKAFVALFARYRLVYGVFSGAVLFLLWLQVFAHLILLGGIVIARHSASSSLPDRSYRAGRRTERLPRAGGGSSPTGRAA
jgi:YihY family inner membrane protein